MKEKKLKLYIIRFVTVIAFFIFICFLYSNNPLYKPLESDMIWAIIVIGGIFLIIANDLYYFLKKVWIKTRIKHCRKSIISMTVINKYHIKGRFAPIPGDKFLGRYPDSYIIELIYKDIKHSIKDEELFNTLNIGDTLNVTLIENFDKNNNVVSYSIEYK